MSGDIPHDWESTCIFVCENTAILVTSHFVLFLPFFLPQERETLSSCINHECFWCFDIWDLADPFRVSQLAEMVKDSPVGLPFVRQQPIPSPPLLPPSLWGSHTQAYCPPSGRVLITPGPGTRLPETAPVPQPTEVIHTSQSWACSPISPLGNHNKAPSPWYPHRPCPRIQPGALPRATAWHCVSLLLELGVTNWQSSPDLLASPYLNKSKTFVLKHLPLATLIFYPLINISTYAVSQADFLGDWATALPKGKKTRFPC